MGDKRSQMADVMAAIRQSIESGPPSASDGRPVRMSDIMEGGADAEGGQTVPPPAKPAAGLGTPANGRTVDELVADLLEPLLKDWLDRHLPAIVESVVREEVQRVTRR